MDRLHPVNRQMGIGHQMQSKKVCSVQFIVVYTTYVVLICGELLQDSHVVCKLWDSET